MSKSGTRLKEKRREGIGIITSTNLGEIGSTAHDQLNGWAGQVTVKAGVVHEGSSLPFTRLGNQSRCLFVTRTEHAFWIKVAVFYHLNTLRTGDADLRF